MVFSLVAWSHDFTPGLELYILAPSLLPGEHDTTAIVVTGKIIIMLILSICQVSILQLGGRVVLFYQCPRLGSTWLSSGYHSPALPTELSGGHISYNTFIHNLCGMIPIFHYFTEQSKHQQKYEFTSCTHWHSLTRISMCEWCISICECCISMCKWCISMWEWSISMWECYISMWKCWISMCEWCISMCEWCISMWECYISMWECWISMCEYWISIL